MTNTEISIQQQQQQQQQQDTLLDALPYVDEFDEKLRKQAQLLVEQEMKTFVPKNYLEHLPVVELHFKPWSEDLERDWAKMEQTGTYTLPDLDKTRYSLPPPPEHLSGDLAAWQRAVDNAKAQLEHQLNRIENLELLRTYGPNAWIVYIQHLERLKERLQQILSEYRKEIDNVNKQRKAEQYAAATKLKMLKDKFYELVNKNVEIDSACQQLEHEIQLLRQKLSSTKSHGMTNPTNVSVPATSSSSDSLNRT
jgi:pre-mRNA-splicing factor SPF27